MRCPLHGVILEWNTNDPNQEMQVIAMIGENQQLVPNELVELEK